LSGEKHYATRRFSLRKYIGVQASHLNLDFRILTYDQDITAMDGTPIVKETTVNAPIEKVWRALTVPAEMKKWYFDIPDFKPIVGHKFEFIAGDEKTKYRHLCRVTEVVTEKKLAYTWTYEGFNTDSIVTFELFEAGGNAQTRVRLTHQGVEKFPTKDPNFKRESFEAGWNEIIGKLLVDYLKPKA
jgi:uncharacterized protein YndB with AHSA1/START domain